MRTLDLKVCWVRSLCISHLTAFSRFIKPPRLNRDMTQRRIRDPGRDRCTHKKSGAHRGCDPSYSHHHGWSRQHPQVDKARATETHLSSHSPKLRPPPVTALSSLDRGHRDPESKQKQERPGMLPFPCCWWDHRSGEGKAGCRSTQH